MITLESLLAAMLWVAPWSEYAATKAAACAILHVHGVVQIEVAFAATTWLHRGGGFAAWSRLNDPSGTRFDLWWQHAEYCREVGDCNPVRMSIAVALARFSAGTDCGPPGMVGMPAAVTFARTGHCQPDAATTAWARSFRMISSMLSPGIESRTP